MNPEPEPEPEPETELGASSARLAVWFVCAAVSNLRWSLPYAIKLPNSPIYLHRPPLFHRCLISLHFIFSPHRKGPHPPHHPHALFLSAKSGHQAVPSTLHYKLAFTCICGHRETILDADLRLGSCGQLVALFEAIAIFSQAGPLTPCVPSYQQ